ncbi:hydrolase [Superficieibacter electus]|uniref:Hydrolase n=1 Tax=Superficieibacter electus TaxID=2022662 RepID=A0A2P5GLN1_9ENTR|nr:HAD-IIB family hydrolase [Superficieibacter electus]POP43769.1 hydrolase [Superficieibacter electus]POP46178.1 hydrolase [Superficieibacter electus]
MSWRLIAFDLDGTLLNRNKHILPASQAVLRQLQAMSYKIILVTGRSHIQAFDYYQMLALTEPMICCNGSYIYQPAHQHYLYTLPIMHSQAESIITKIHPLKPTILADDRVMTGGDALNVRENIWQISIVHRQLEQLHHIADYVQHELNLTCTWSWRYQLDIIQANCSKGQSLARYAQQQHIAMRDVIAFGDNDNDAEMLHLAGLGIAMGNASTRAKACADMVTGDNNTPAIADFLTNLLALEAY